MLAATKKSVSIGETTVEMMFFRRADVDDIFRCRHNVHVVVKHTMGGRKEVMR
jgi:hypothetical protein